MDDAEKRKELIPGALERLTYTVRETDLASQLALIPDEAFPPVLATTRAIALLELVSARLLLRILRPGELSVGVIVDVKHTAATPAGANVLCTARFTGYDEKSKLYSFEVSASDDAGEVMRGVHKRAIIDSDRLLASARKRAGSRG
jgi:fluoroacetyl-CoA thioesterase